MKASALWPGRQGGSGHRAVIILLTLVSGALNAISFMALGGVFVSVMTANLALVGIAVGRFDLPLAGHSVVALVGYVAGVLLGARFCGRCARRRRSGPRTLLFGELVLLCAVMTGWLVTDGGPPALLQIILLAATALAMGCQGATIRAAGPPGLSTTYMTGLLTGLLTDALAGHRPDWNKVALLAAVPVGAALGALVVVTARTGAPLLPVVLLAAALVLTPRATAR
ncbi:YoaK family protein [Streptomyces sp. NPDC054802]